MIDWSRATCLVTGASGGIGLAMAELLAKRGSRIILVSRNAESLELAARRISLPGAPAPVVIPMDLAQPGAADALFRETERMGLQVDILVNNAGCSIQGPFAQSKASSLEEMLYLDVVTIAMLARLYLPGMLSRRSGAIINLSSIAAFHPLPTMAAYAASKAFVLSLSEALWVETRGTGVRILALCPGATDTGFFRSMGRDLHTPKVTPISVAASALKALDRDAMTFVPGFLNAFRSRLLPRLLPRRLTAIATGRIISRLYV